MSMSTMQTPTPSTIISIPPTFSIHQIEEYETHEKLQKREIWFNS
jgi:hypothetical protein